MRITTAFALLLSVTGGFVAASLKAQPAAACYLNTDCREDCTECADSIGYDGCWACAGTCLTSGEIVLCS